MTVGCGGPESVTADGTARARAVVFELGVPVLGICYGMQTMAAQLGGPLGNPRVRLFAQVRARSHSGLPRDSEDHATAKGFDLLDVWMRRGDRLTCIFVDNGLLCLHEGAR